MFLIRIREDIPGESAKRRRRETALIFTTGAHGKSQRANPKATETSVQLDRDPRIPLPVHLISELHPAHTRSHPYNAADSRRYLSNPCVPG